jgi:hypothetical protein
MNLRPLYNVRLFIGPAADGMSEVFLAFKDHFGYNPGKISYFVGIQRILTLATSIISKGMGYEQ